MSTITIDGDEDVISDFLNDARIKAYQAKRKIVLVAAAVKEESVGTWRHMINCTAYFLSWSGVAFWLAIGTYAYAIHWSNHLAEMKQAEIQHKIDREQYATAHNGDILYARPLRGTPHE